MEKKKLLNALSALLFIVAIVLWFVVDALVYKGTLVTTSYKFLDVAFGVKPSNGNDELKFSMMNVLTLVLLLAGAGLALYRTILKPTKKKKGSAKLLGFLLFALGVVGVVFVLLTKSFVVPGNGLIEAVVDEMKPTGGLIGIAVLSGLGGLAGVASDIL